MSGLIYAELTAARKGQSREQAITLVLNWIAGNLVFCQLSDKCIHIVAHQVELVHVILLRGMNGNLRRRQSENQPSVANIYIGELENIA